MFWISAFPTVAWKVASGRRFKRENRTTWWSSHRCRMICVYIISIYKYFFFCVRARGTAFSHCLWPQCPNSGHARRGCTLLGLVWSSTSTTTRAHSPPWHRRLRAKRSRLRQFVKRLYLQPSLSTRQCLRGARAVTFLSGHHSLPISIHYRLGLQPWLVNQSKALRCHGIILDCQIQTIQEKQWRPRRARQGGSKLPLLRSCSGFYLGLIIRWCIASGSGVSASIFSIKRSEYCSKVGWGVAGSGQGKICVWNNAKSTMPGNANKRCWRCGFSPRHQLHLIYNSLQ